jgi:phospholipid/cholesterol/gamma-HCH transport system ATP-binding protein
MVSQLDPTPGLPERQAVARRKERVMNLLHTLPRAAQQAILDSFSDAGATGPGMDAAGAYGGPR